MKIKVDFFDNEIILNNQEIFSVEIENKQYFYRLVRELYSIGSGDISEQVHFFDETKEVLSPKITIYNDYFDIDLSSKKYSFLLYKKILNNIDYDDNNKIFKSYKNIYERISHSLMCIDLPINIEQEYNLEDLLKMFKVSIKNTSDSIFNLVLLLVDISSSLIPNEILVFVNLKQYLTSIELTEVYKYSLYKGVIIFMIDNQTYGISLENEKKMIIDDNLDEFML